MGGGGGVGIWIIRGGGAVMYPCTKYVANYRGSCSPGNFDFGPSIRCTLGLFPHKHNIHLSGEILSLCPVLLMCEFLILGKLMCTFLT